MATKKNKIWEYAAILGGAGLLYYFYNKNQTATTTLTTSTTTTPVTTVIPPATTATLPPPPSTIAPLPVTVVPAQMVTVTPDIVAPATTAATAATAAAASLTDAQQKVIAFMRTDLDEANLAQFLNSYPSFTAAEWAGLYDLIVNDWQGGQGNTPARVLFWNTWRSKYHILDGTFN